MFKENSDVSCESHLINLMRYEKSNLSPISVNWHISPFCNYKCKYCFGHFRNFDKFLNLKDSKTLIQHLVGHGTQKITFSGGEPFFNPYLGELIQFTKDLGVVSMIVSNGSLISTTWLDRYASSLDWLGLSIDSSFEATQKRLGRGTGYHVQLIRNLVPIINDYGVSLKINTVVTAFNWKEDLHFLMNSLAPKRWKVFKFLPILGENEEYEKALGITDEQFAYFIDRHRDLSPIAEKNPDMSGSYVMIDPMGRLFQNTSKKLEYSKPIQKIGIIKALNELKWDWEKFIERGGLYNW